MSGGTRAGGMIFRWGPVAIYVLLIFYLSSLSDPPGAPRVPHFDKLVHLAEYAVLGFLIGRALGLTGKRDRYLVFLAISAGIGAGVALADELYQSTVSGRDASPLDFLANLAGLSLSLVLLRALAARRGGEATSTE